DTTAAQLFHHWMRQRFPGVEPSTHYALFDEVYARLRSGNARQGVVIHEHRFTWQRDGLRMYQDLGAYWESVTQMPIPLGVIVMRETLGAKQILAVDSAIRKSLEWAWNRVAFVSPFVSSHAQAMELDVMEAHIRMFVNAFSRDPGTAGVNALRALWKAQ
ncbi:MAG TPA: MqnA/MqnD/SBP family protein, partial [Fibrobacteraceae bacterium]|nr:MqnA/MqnD/SBP family protein [Fibrobacteraceae bacterium]